MARSKNTLTDVSPASAQFKAPSSLSILERTSLNSLSQTSGSFGYGAGGINGSVITSMQNLSNRDRSKQEIGGLYAEGLEKAGLTSGGAGSILSSTIGPSIDNRRPIHRNTPLNAPDLSISSNRVPDSNRRSPEQKIEQKKGRTLQSEGGISFPPDLEQNTHAYVKLKFYEYKRPDSFGAGDLTPTTTLNLPLPEDFEQEFSVNYQSSDIGVYGAAAATGSGQKAINELMTKLKGGGQLDLKSAFAGGASALSEVGSYMGFKTLSGVNESIGGLVGQELGFVPNPHPSIFLEGVDLRTYQMTWNLTPRDESEAAIIRNILKLLKDKCLPKKAGSYLTYPEMIEPLIVSTVSEMQSYKKSMMAAMTVNYSGAGASAFFYDGHPVSIILTLELQEAELFLEDNKNSDIASLVAGTGDFTVAGEGDGEGGE